MPITIETTAFAGWDHCIKLSNGKLEVTVTTDVGPRVIGPCTPGGPNHMAVFPETAGVTGGSAQHLERWDVFADVEKPERDDASVTAALRGRILR